METAPAPGLPWRNAVSILDRLRVNGHLDDTVLVQLWTERSLSDGAARLAVHPHLQACSVCRLRLAALDDWMAELRTDANAEADQAFPVERLAAQQAQVLRRLAAAERPARVIAFPRLTRPLSSSTSPVRRWVAAAAAAGLVVGLGLGQVMDLRRPLGAARAINEARPESSRPDRLPSGIVTVSTTSLPDTFLMDLDASLARQSMPEGLRALDEFTPRTGERPK